jgi:hypothetical protein
LPNFIVLTTPVPGLDQKVIAKGFQNNGQGNNATPGQVPSLTSSNNFINFCLTVPDKPITNGQQVTTGSCNPAPMGIIAATTNMPSSKFVNPTNFQVIKAGQSFDIKMAISHLQAGNFVNADLNYFAGPQQVNNAGDIVGHTHFVVQKVDSFTSTKVLEPSVFAFFKGVDTAADKDGNVGVTLTGGLPEGSYRLASINTSANHAPVVVAVAQHGSHDDQVYVSVLHLTFVYLTKLSSPFSSQSLLMESPRPILESPQPILESPRPILESPRPILPMESRPRPGLLMESPQPGLLESPRPILILRLNTRLHTMERMTAISEDNPYSPLEQCIKVCTSRIPSAC